MRTVSLTLRAARRVLVADLDWQGRPGECWSIIGRNGVGKSTLLRTLAGLREPDSGFVELDHRPLVNWPLADLARQRAYLPQSRHDAFGYKAIETVLAARHPYQDAGYWESDKDYAAALIALERLDAGHLADRDVRTLSGGERQRVAFAALLAQDTPFLLLDEPTSALDMAHQADVVHLLKNLCRTAGKTVLFVSHDLNLARSVSSHALLLMGDGIWHAGTAGEIMTASLLSDCLGHPVGLVEHAGRVIYFSEEKGGVPK